MLKDVFQSPYLREECLKLQNYLVKLKTSSNKEPQQQVKLKVTKQHLQTLLKDVQLLELNERLDRLLLEKDHDTIEKR